MSTEAPQVAEPVAPVVAPVSGVNDPWGKEWIQPDFTLNHKALDRLPDHLKGLRPTLERQRSFEDVLTVMQNQQVMAGKKALAPLPSDAPAHVAAERKALLDTINGVPPSPKDYGLSRPEDFPESQWSQPLADGFTAWAHKHSVSPIAAKELLSIQMGAVKGQIEAQGQYEQNFFAQQQQAFDKQIKQDNIAPDRASALVDKGALALGLDPKLPEHQTLLKNANVRLMAMRHAIQTGEDSFVQGGNSNTREVNDPEALAGDAVRNPANPLYAQYWNKDNKFSRAQQDAAVQKVNEWHRQAAAKNPPRGRR
jgi:hypothetical protein